MKVESMLESISRLTRTCDMPPKVNFTSAEMTDLGTHFFRAGMTAMSDWVDAGSEQALRTAASEDDVDISDPVDEGCRAVDMADCSST